MTPDLLCRQLLEVGDGKVGQKRKDGSQKVWRPCGDVAHRTWLQESFHKGFFLQHFHAWAVVSNGGQPEEQHRTVSITKWAQRLKFSPHMTYTLSLTISEAGKLMISETDMKGMNWDRSTNNSGVTRGNLWIKAAVIVSMACNSLWEAWQSKQKHRKELMRIQVDPL